MKKRLLATLLSLVMVLTMLPVSAFAAAALNITAVSSVDDQGTKYVTLTATKDVSGTETAVNEGLYYKLAADKSTAEGVAEPSVANLTGSDGFTAYDNKFALATNDTYVVVVAATVTSGSVTSIDNMGIAPIKAVATGLTVTAVKGDANADPAVDPVFAVKAGDEGKLDGSYYRISQDVPTAPCVGDEITVGNEEGNWTQYVEASFKFTTDGKYIEVVTTTDGDSGEKLVALWGYAEITDPVAALGELTVTVTNNVIAVTKDDEDVTTNLVYYKADQAKIALLATEKAKWNADTALTVVTEFFTEASKLTLEDATITEDEDGSFIVAVQTDAKGEKVVAVGATGAAVEFKDNSALPFQLYAGEVTTPGAGDTDLMTDVTESSGKYAVTVPAGTTKVSVVGDVTVAKNVDSDTTITVNGKVVTLAESGASTFKVSTTGDPSTDYVVEVTKTPAEDFTKPGIVIATTADAETGNVLAGTETFDEDTAENTYTISKEVDGTEVYVTTDEGTVTVSEGATWDPTNKKVTLATTDDTVITVTRNEKKYVITLTKKSGGADTVAALTIEKATVDEDGNVTLVVKNGSTVIESYSYKFADTAGTKPETQETPAANEYTATTTGTDITGGTAGKYIVVVQLSDNKIVSWGSKVLTAETPVVSEFTALTVDEDDERPGKVKVTAAEGADLSGVKVVILEGATAPNWTASTSEEAVSAAIGNAQPSEYAEDAINVPAAKEEVAQHVVAYKIEEGKVTAFGVMTIEGVSRTITVTDDENTELITFDKGTTNYTVPIVGEVQKVLITANLGALITGADGGEVAAAPGEVSTVTIKFGDGAADTYTIKIYWPAGSVSPDDSKVDTTVDTSSGSAVVDLTNDVDDTVMTIVNTATVNKDVTSEADKTPVSIDATATNPADAKATTEVKLPAAVSEALVKTEVPVKITTDAGTVTLPSAAISAAQGDEADVLTVVVENTSAETVQPEDDVRASFKVTIEKNGVATEDVTGLAEANWITLVFTVPNTVIDGVEEPILAWDDNGTYKELESSDYEKGKTETVFTAKTSHLTDFVVIGKALLSPAPSTDEFAISVQGEELVPGFSAGVLNYEVTTDAESATIEVKNAATGSTVTVNGQTYSTPVNVTVTEGTKVEVVYTLADGTTKKTYTITFKKKTQEEQPLDELEIFVGDSTTGETIKFESGKAKVTLSATQSSFKFSVPAGATVTAEGAKVDLSTDGSEATVTATATSGTVTIELKNGDKYTIDVTKTAAPPTGNYTIESESIGFGGNANQFKQVTLKGTDANKVYLIEVTDSNYGSGQHNFLVVNGNGNDVSFYLLNSASHVNVWEVNASDILSPAGDELLYPYTVNPREHDLA